MGWTDFVPILGDVIDFIGNRAQAKDNWNMQQKQNQFNAKEAQKQRDWASTERQASEFFNHFQAIESRNWQEKMVNQQNEFNLPVNQLRRMQDAGINPSMLQMDGTIASASPTGNPQASSSPLGGSAASSAGLIPAVNPFNNVDPILSMLQARKFAAETEAIEDANNRENEKHPYEIETAKGNIRLIGMEYDLKDSQRKKFEAEIPVINQTASNLSEQFKSIQLQNGLTQKQLDAFDKRFDLEVREFEDRHALSLVNVREIKQHIANLISDNKIKGEQFKSLVDSNYLSGLQVKVKKNNQEALLQLMWDKEKAQYDLDISDLKTQQRRAGYRNNDSDTWIGSLAQYELDVLSLLSEAIGFSAGVSGSTNQSNSHSTSRSTSSSVSDVFTHRE